MKKLENNIFLIMVLIYFWGINFSEIREENTKQTDIFY